MVARAINAEFRHVDKVVRSLGVSTVRRSFAVSLFSVATPSPTAKHAPAAALFMSLQLVVTDTWIILIGQYSMQIALQSDVDLS